MGRLLQAGITSSVNFIYAKTGVFPTPEVGGGFPLVVNFSVEQSTSDIGVMLFGDDETITIPKGATAVINLRDLTDMHEQVVSWTALKYMRLFHDPTSLASHIQIDSSIVSTGGGSVPGLCTPALSPGAEAIYSDPYGPGLIFTQETDGDYNAKIFVVNLDHANPATARLVTLGV